MGKLWFQIQVLFPVKGYWLPGVYSRTLRPLGHYYCPRGAVKASWQAVRFCGSCARRGWEGAQGWGKGAKALLLRVIVHGTYHSLSKWVSPDGHGLPTQPPAFQAG